MRNTICSRCGKEFIEEHNPDNFICDECWDKIGADEFDVIISTEENEIGNVY
jgi:DNA-directed RNA polymerase subunit RPC12/RpoP